jgi:hypothetical protein
MEQAPTFGAEAQIVRGDHALAFRSGLEGGQCGFLPGSRLRCYFAGVTFMRAVAAHKPFRAVLNTRDSAIEADSATWKGTREEKSSGK